jgi:hypothetical protein
MLQICGALPRHRFSLTTQPGMHWPSMQTDAMSQGAWLRHWPVASHSCGVLPAHCCAPGEHTGPPPLVEALDALEALEEVDAPLDEALPEVLDEELVDAPLDEVLAEVLDEELVDAPPEATDVGAGEVVLVVRLPPAAS